MGAQHALLANGLPGERNASRIQDGLGRFLQVLHVVW